MSFDKTVKNACKAKDGAPKSKYLDPLIAATHTQDGSVPDICRALGARLREPNSNIVFKALLVLHSMIRQGSTDNVLTFLSENDVLRLKGNIAGQTWDGKAYPHLRADRISPYEDPSPSYSVPARAFVEFRSSHHDQTGYSPPNSLKAYAMYLDTRIIGYKGLRHDPVRLQSENNRSNRYDGPSAKAKRLNSLTVDKGLLREVRETQKMVGTLIQCRFFEDDLHDPCTIMAFRLVVKDLLVLVQAVNEGVVNLLEHYFEMLKTDAQDALAIYKAFCKQNEKVVEYLNTAKRLNNVLDVPVPNLKHAPVSLVKALEEYLNDPNFEQNRVEYRQNMAAASGAPSRSPATTSDAIKPAPTASKPAEAPEPAPAQSSAPPQPAAQQQVSRSIQDFFTSIEEENKQHQQQQNYGQNNSFMNQMGMGMGGMGVMGGMAMAQPPTANPFRQSMMMPNMTGFNPMQMQMTGQPFPSHQQGGGFIQPGQQEPQNAFVQPQQTGFPPQNTAFMQPQSTGFPAQSSPFQQPQQQNAFAQPTPLQPQSTGFNPFRQSMLMPQSTGLPFQSPSTNSFQPTNRSSSAPISSPPKQTQPLQAQPTGSKNPFALPSDNQPKRQQSTGPSLFELAMQNSMATSTQQNQQQQPQSLAPQPTGYAGSSIAPFSSRMGQSAFATQFGTSTPPKAASPPPQQQQNTSSGGQSSIMSDLASAFATTTTNDIPPPSQSNGVGSSNVSGLFGSGGMFGQSTGTGGGSSAFGGGSSGGLTGQSTGATSFSSQAPPTPTSSNFLQPQPTGFAGSSIKPFKPSSNFGSTLVTEVPTSPTGLPSPTSQGGNAFGGASGASNAFGGNAGGATSPTTGINPQSTGFNPFGNFSGGQGTNPSQPAQNAFGGGASPFGQQQTGMGNGQAATNNNWAKLF